MPEFTAQALIQKGRITLDPAPNGNVIHRQSRLRHQLLQIPIAQRITQVPSNAKDDNHILEVSPAEQHWPVLAHRITLPEAGRAVCYRSVTPATTKSSRLNSTSTLRSL